MNTKFKVNSPQFDYYYCCCYCFEPRKKARKTAKEGIVCQVKGEANKGEGKEEGKKKLKSKWSQACHSLCVCVRGYKVPSFNSQRNQSLLSY